MILPKPSPKLNKIFILFNFLCILSIDNRSFDQVY